MKINLKKNPLDIFDQAYLIEELSAIFEFSKYHLLIAFAKCHVKEIYFKIFSSCRNLSSNKNCSETPY